MTTTPDPLHRPRHSRGRRPLAALVAAAAAGSLLLSACSTDETVYSEDPIPNEGEAVDADAQADGVVDGTEDGFGPESVADPSEGSDIDSDGANEISPDEAEG